jgi:hypothetical protein
MDNHDYSWLGDLLGDLVDIIEGPRGLLVIVLGILVVIGVAYAFWG